MCSPFQVDRCQERSFVKVFDGSTRNSRLLGNFCGAQKRPKLVVSSGSQVLIVVALKDEEFVGFRWSAETGSYYHLVMSTYVSIKDLPNCNFSDVLSYH